MNRLRRILLLLVFPFVADAQNRFIADSLETYINREMARWNIPGMAVTVVKDGRVVFMRGFGVREAGRKEAVDAHTLFQIASCTKAFTGTALAWLHVQQRLSLDDRITAFRPSFALHDTCATREVTVRDMLCHRIGFRTFQSDFLNWDCNLTRDALIANMRNVKPVYSFRSRFGYCNAGFLAAGELIPAVTDTSWDDFLRHRFFVPLGMNRTSTDQASILNDANAAKPYTLLAGKLVPLAYADIDALAPAASINSSVHDMANWLLMLLDSGRFAGREVVPWEAIRLTRSSHTVVSGDPAGRRRFLTYGLGWFLEDFKGQKVVSHDGGANGFLSNATLLPEANAGFAIFTNTDANGLYEALQHQLIDALLDEPYVNHSAVAFASASVRMAQEDSARQALLASAAGKSPAQPPAAYAGRYRNEVYGGMEVKHGPGGLSLHFAHHPRLTGKLTPLGGHRFVCVYSDVTYGVKEIPFEEEDGRIVSVTIRVNDFIDAMPYVFRKEE
jgi:CubicO group peptidase (beta-lactamase class C family)